MLCQLTDAEYLFV